MARRTFDVVDATEILIHQHAGRSLSEISQRLDVDRKTIRKYVAAAIEAGLVPGGPPLPGAEWDARVREWPLVRTPDHGRQLPHQVHHATGRRPREYVTNA